MGIDRIGKGAGGAGSPVGGLGGADGLPGEAVPGAQSAKDASAPFAVRPKATEGAARTTEATGPNAALERLRAGEIDARTYVELKVDEATRHLSGLRATDLDTIRSELRHRMSADPALADLVNQATGGASVDPPEE